MTWIQSWEIIRQNQTGNILQRGQLASIKRIKVSQTARLLWNSSKPEDSGDATTEYNKGHYRDWWHLNGVWKLKVVFMLVFCFWSFLLCSCRVTDHVHRKYAVTLAGLGAVGTPDLQLVFRWFRKRNILFTILGKPTQRLPQMAPKWQESGERSKALGECGARLGDSMESGERSKALGECGARLGDSRGGGQLSGSLQDSRKAQLSYTRKSKV